LTREDRRAKGCQVNIHDKYNEGRSYTRPDTGVANIADPTADWRCEVSHTAVKRELAQKYLNKF